MKKSFVIQTRLEYIKPLIRVVVYDTMKELQAATRSWDAAGLTERYHKEDNSGRKILTRRQVATIHLSRENLGVGVVSHEAAHASTHIWELIHTAPIRSESDEAFAWMLGDITRKIYNGLYRLKIL